MTLPPLLPQQVLVRDFELEHSEAAIYVEAGLGKSRATMDALTHLIHDGEIRGAVIVAPKRVATLAWPAELEKWNSPLTYANLRTPEGKVSWDRGDKDLYIINYEMLPQFVEQCLKKRKHFPADAIVWDESNRSRNPSSKRIKAFMPYREKFKRHIGLTGTPQPNSALDLFGQIKLLDGGKRLGPSFHAFRNRYAESDFMAFKWELLPGSEQMIWEKIRDMTLVLRAEEYLHIPPVSYVDIDVTLPPPIMREYKKLQRDMLIQIGSKEVVALSAAALVQKLAQFASGASYVQEDGRARETVHIHDGKIDALTKLHKDIGYKPLLVFTQFVHEAERIIRCVPHSQMFDENKIGQWDAGKIPMWVTHPASTGHGLNLQAACSNVCWFSLGYSWDFYSQGNSRIARTGQTQPTTIYRLLAQDTIDWAQLEVIRGKAEGEAGLKSVLKFVKVLDKAPAAA